MTGPVLPSRLWVALQHIEGLSPAREEQASAWVDAVERHRLLPQALAHPGEWSAPLRRQLECRLEQLQPMWRARVQDQAATLARLLGLLGEGDFIVVKGADVATRLYGEPLLRPMDDVDLLVRETALLGSVDRLCRAGWTVQRRTHLEVTLRDPHNGVLVDLYRGFAQDERAAIRKEVFWTQATRGSHGALSLNLAHALLMECLVFANGHFRGHLRRLVDLWLLAAQASVVEEALEYSQRWELRRVLYAGLHQLVLVAPEVRDNAWHAAMQQLIDPSERRVLERHVLPGQPVVHFEAPSHSTSLTRLYARLVLIDRPTRAAHFLAAHLARVTFGRG